MSKQDESRATSVAADAAEHTLSALSDSLDTAGAAARRSGLAVRDRFRDSARALERGGRVVRTSGIAGAVTASVLAFRRHKKALLGTAGALAGSVLALGLLRRVRTQGADSE